MINLTSSEKKTIIFTSALLIVSGLYQWIQPNKIKNPGFDYSKSDSVFSRLSHISNVTLKENQNAKNTDSTKVLKIQDLSVSKKRKKTPKEEAISELIELITRRILTS